MSLLSPRVLYALALLCAPAMLHASLPCDQWAELPRQHDCPQTLDVSAGGSLDGWTVWIGRLCLTASLADVARVLLDDARVCEWRDCESVCLVPTEAGVPPDDGTHACNQTTFTKLERKLLAVFPLRLGSLTNRVVRHEAGVLTIAYRANAHSHGKRGGVPVVTRSNAVFSVESVAQDRVLVRYCQWAIPPPVFGMMSKGIGNRAAKEDLRTTMHAMARVLRETPPAESLEPPLGSCDQVRLPVCPAD